MNKTQRANEEPRAVDKVEARSCPWCGHQPYIEPWHGGKPTKVMVSCNNGECCASPSVTGQTRKESLEAWNTRKA